MFSFFLLGFQISLFTLSSPLSAFGFILFKCFDLYSTFVAKLRFAPNEKLGPFENPFKRLIITFFGRFLPSLARKRGIGVLDFAPLDNFSYAITRHEKKNFVNSLFTTL